MKKLNVFIILFVAALSFLSSCCKVCQDPANPDCENYDPCFKKLSADFTMGIVVQGYSGNRYFEVDTCRKMTVITFQAKDSTDVTYEWKIGLDTTTFRDRRVDLLFEQPGVIDIRLITKRVGNCNVQPLADTVFKKLVVSDPDLDIFFGGTYQGYIESNPNDVFDITILRDTLAVDPGFYMNNIPKGCAKRTPANQENTRINFAAFRDFEFGRKDAAWEAAPCNNTFGWGKLGKDGSIRLDYKKVVGREFFNEIFIGKKIK